MKRTNQHTVLSIDDDITFNFLIERSFQLFSEDIKCIIYDNAFDAMDYLKQASEGLYNFPDLMLVDINMPLMSGFEFIEQYENTYLNLNSDCIVYFLSSSTRESDKTRALDYTCVNGFFTKDHITEVAEKVWEKHFVMSEMIK